MMDGWDMTGWGWGWMSLMMVIPVLIAALLALAVLRGPGSRTGRRDEDAALEALRHRFATGEIDEDEFNRRRAALARSV